MRILLLSFLAAIVLTSCMKKEEPAVNFPPEAKMMSGYEYPAMPLDQYNQLNSGTVTTSGE